MLRAVLVGVLALALPACSKSSEPVVKTQPGAPAGKVLEVSGKVTAERGGQTRALAVGDSVSGDDTIETAADASVKIELAHNHVELALGPSSKKRVDTTVAWSAPTKSSVGKSGEGDTAAAGRPMERSAADGVATAPAPPAVEAAAPDMEMARMDDEKKEETAPAPPAMQPNAAPRALSAADSTGGGGGAQGEPPPPPPPPPADLAPPPKIGAKQAIPPTSPLASATASGRGAALTPEAAVDALLAQHESALQACLARGGADHAEFIVNVDAKGKASVVLFTKLQVPQKTYECVAKIVEAVHFPAVKTSTHLKVQKP